jgi:YVTN family beta-propeller protein
MTDAPLAAACGLALALCVACGDPAPVPSGPGLYVSNEMSGDVAVVDLATRAVTAHIRVGKRPRGIRVSPDGKTVYVALSGSPVAGPGVDETTLPPPDRKLDGIGVIDVTLGRFVRMLPSGTDPEQFAVSLDGRHLFISNEDAATLSVLDVAAGTIVKAVKVGGEPEGVDLSPDGRFVYVTSEYEGTVTVVDTATLAPVATIKVDPRPRSTAFSLDGTRAYVSAENGGVINVIDAVAHRALGTLPVSGETWKPMGTVMAPDGATLFVTMGRGRVLAWFDVRSQREVAAVDVGDRPWGLALSPDGRTAYTANGPSNDISIVDVSERRVVARVATGERPWGLALVR